MQESQNERWWAAVQIYSRCRGAAVCCFMSADNCCCHVDWPGLLKPWVKTMQNGLFSCSEVVPSIALLDVVFQVVNDRRESEIKYERPGLFKFRSMGAKLLSNNYHMWFIPGFEKLIFMVLFLLFTQSTNLCSKNLDMLKSDYNWQSKCSHKFLFQR